MSGTIFKDRFPDQYEPTGKNIKNGCLGKTQKNLFDGRAIKRGGGAGKEKINVNFFFLGGVGKALMSRPFRPFKKNFFLRLATDNRLHFNVPVHNISDRILKWP